MITSLFSVFFQNISITISVKSSQNLRTEQDRDRVRGHNPALYFDDIKYAVVSYSIFPDYYCVRTLNAEKKFTQAMAAPSRKTYWYPHFTQIKPPRSATAMEKI